MFGLKESFSESASGGGRTVGPPAISNTSARTHEAIGPLARPKVFARMTVEGFPMDRPTRERWGAGHGIIEIG
ncbi:MAG: hypothetical protein ACKV2U_13335 [Bryobacteraceae bacterium]